MVVGVKMPAAGERQILVPERRFVQSLFKVGLRLISLDADMECADAMAQQVSPD